MTDLKQCVKGVADESLCFHNTLTVPSGVTGPEVIIPFSCSAQLRRSKPEISIYFGYFCIHEQFKFCAQLR